MFIAPPSLDMLEDRLISMQKYNPMTIEQKIEEAPAQLESAIDGPLFDAMITNETDELDFSYNEVVYQIISWYTDAEIDPPAAVKRKGDTEGEEEEAAEEKSLKSNKSAKSSKSNKSNKSKK